MSAATALELVVATDATSSRRVYAVIVALAAIGVAFAGLAWWLVRRTRVEPELLAPLERMSERRWLRHDPAERHRLLDEVRPAGAEPLTKARSLPNVDPEMGPAGPPQRTLDDLADVGLRRSAVSVAPVRAVPPPPPGLAPPSAWPRSASAPGPSPLPPPAGSPDAGPDGPTSPASDDDDASTVPDGGSVGRGGVELDRA